MNIARSNILQSLDHQVAKIEIRKLVSVLVHEPHSPLDFLLYEYPSLAPLDFLLYECPSLAPPPLDFLL